MCLENVHQKGDPGSGSEVFHHGLIRVLLIGEILKLWNNFSPILSISLFFPLYYPLLSCLPVLSYSGGQGGIWIFSSGRQWRGRVTDRYAWVRSTRTNIQRSGMWGACRELTKKTGGDLWQIITRQERSSMRYKTSWSGYYGGWFRCLQAGGEDERYPLTILIVGLAM
jgi:hypothetical protein